MPPILPVKNASSSCSVPRATVPSTSGLALEPSAKNALGAQAAVLRLVVHVLPAAAADDRPERSTRTRAARARAHSSDLVDLLRPEALQELRVAPVIELRIRRLDRQEEPVWLACAAKRSTLNTGWYGIGKPFSANMPKTAANDGEQDRQLEGHRE